MDEINFALLLIRVVAGFTMAAHGYGKFFTGGRIPGTAGWFDSMGMRPGKVHAVLAAGGEVASGVCLALGFFTTFACLGFVGLMVVAGVTVHIKNGFFILKEGWEYVFMLAIVAVTIAMLGPGEWSVDNGIGWADELDGWTGLAISAGGGALAAAALLGMFYRPPAAESS